MLQILDRDYIQQGLCKEVKDALKSRMEFQADVKAVGDISLELVDGFMILLRDVLFVPLLHRNLISVSRLDKDSYECYFTHGKCAIWFKDACVGTAILHNELFLLSLREKVHSVCNVNEQTSLSNKEQKKRKRTHDSSKLWHCRLGHISRGRIENLITNDIPPPLEFSDIEQCIDCIKGKYVGISIFVPSGP
jgi:hypothetical protein